MDTEDTATGEGHEDEGGHGDEEGQVCGERGEELEGDTLQIQSLEGEGVWIERLLDVPNRGKRKGQN